MKIETKKGFDIAIEKKGMAFAVDYDLLVVRTLKEGDVSFDGDGYISVNRKSDEPYSVFSTKEEADFELADWIDKVEIPNHKGDERKRLLRLAGRVRKDKNKTLALYQEETKDGNAAPKIQKQRNDAQVSAA